MLSIVEHKSASYGPRTWHNAKSADLTVAIAEDFDTFGEKLTKKAAGEKYLAIPFSLDYVKAARLLYRELIRREARVLNVAGNGIYTFAKYGHWQHTVDMQLYWILKQVHAHYPIQKLISGGQTGMDIAAAVVGVKLEIPVELTFPNGFRQRNDQGMDSNHTEAEIREQVMEGVSRLKGL